ncbi:multicopper oxidase domain-containing protein [Okibacterium sp. HSC-33S16]|uniref:multicopper oxidase domain-containing protein n=1 Tax=Okibacterium sp. HSC-33S16 TaxID=2910965 RepID=UPI00209EB00D|nr:multicopper oxidase domain-containing protein [Okibacterium sp. HSC-33S16]
MEIVGRRATALSFNGGIPEPTVRMKAGDRVDITLHNALDHPTKLHGHGLHVSPEGNSDTTRTSVVSRVALCR